MESRYEEFLEILYLEMFKKLYFIALACLKNHHIAEEIVQDVFVQANEKVDSLYMHENPKGWLIKSVKYHLMNANRKRREIALENISEYKREYSAGECDAAAQIKEILTENQWQIVEMVYFKGYTIAEAANGMNVNLEACRKRLYRARKKLKMELVW